MLDDVASRGRIRPRITAYERCGENGAQSPKAGSVAFGDIRESDCAQFEQMAGCPRDGSASRGEDRGEVGAVAVGDPTCLSKLGEGRVADDVEMAFRVSAEHGGDGGKGENEISECTPPHDCHFRHLGIPCQRAEGALFSLVRICMSYPHKTVSEPWLD